METDHNVEIKFKLKESEIQNNTKLITIIESLNEIFIGCDEIFIDGVSVFTSNGGFKNLGVKDE